MKYIKKNNILAIINSSAYDRVKNKNDYVLFDRIKCHIEDGHRITEFDENKKAIIETIDISGLDPRYTVFDDSVEGDYFVNSPFKEMTASEQVIENTKSELIIFNARNKAQIFNDIFVAFENAPDRISDIINADGAFTIAIENRNFVFARLRLAKAKTDNFITQGEHDLIESKIPKN